MGGISYSSVFKTGLEKKEESEPWFTHLTSPEGVTLSSLVWPSKQKQCFLLEDPRRCALRGGVCVQALVVGHSSAWGHRRTYEWSNRWDSFRLSGWRAGV